MEQESVRETLQDLLKLKRDIEEICNSVKSSSLTTASLYLTNYIDKISRKLEEAKSKGEGRE